MDKIFKKNIIKGTIVTSVGQIITIGLLFISSVLLARFMSEKDLGAFFLMMAVWMFLEMFSTLGLEATLVKFLSTAKDDEKNEIFIKLLLIRIIYIVFISSIFFLIVKITIIIDPIINNFSSFIIAIFILDSLRSFFNAELQGTKRFKEMIIVQVVQSIGKILIYGFGVIFSKLTIQFLLYTEIFALVLSFLVQQYLTSVYYSLKNRLSLAEIKEILRFSFPLYMNNLLAVLSNRMNSIIIAGFTNISNVAYYEIGKKIPDGFGRLSSSVVLVFYPYISELFNQKKFQEAKKLLDMYIMSISLVSAPIVFGVYLFRREIISIVFSEKYLDSSFALFLFMLSFSFTMISTLLGYSFVAADKPMVSFRVNIFRTLFALILCLSLVPMVGFIGAVYSIIISSILGYLYSFWFFRNISIDLMPYKYLYPFILMVPFILLSNLNIISENIGTLLFLLFFFLVLEILLFKESKYLIRIFYQKITIFFNTSSRGAK